MKARKSIKLPSGHSFHVEFISNDSGTYWFIWLGANTAFTDGYGVRLYTDGRIEYWRVSADGWETRLEQME